MNDYIKREDACRAMRQLQTDDIEDYGVEIPECFDANRAIKELISLPAADVRPVVRGRWIKHNATHIQKGAMYLECSHCHEYTTVLGHVLAYCPNCGADLRPKEDA